jgi:alpha-maltose-1-phosphate synthase
MRNNNALLVHPGTQYSHQLARQLARHKLLYEFWTGFAMAREAWSTQALQTWLPAKLNRKIANRITQGIPPRLIRTIPTIEWKSIRQLQRGLSSQIVFHEKNKAFQERVPQKSMELASSIIGFDTSSWILAARAEKLNKPFLLDQSIAHPLVKESVLCGVSARFPEWREELESRLPAVLNSENLEHKIASKIVVASTYTKRTLISQGVDERKIIVNPYGVDLQKFNPPTLRHLDSRPLRFLFLGAVSARKGIPLLIKAWESLALKDSELWLVGPVGTRERKLIPKLPGLYVKGKYPFEELPDLMRQCDVLVFPSYCEGFALVLLEALASGMPIISTEATAAPDLIENGKEGLLIQSGDLDALCQTMKVCADNPDKLKVMGEAARRCAERFSWDSYGDRWQQILKEFGEC